MRSPCPIWTTVCFSYVEVCLFLEQAQFSCHDEIDSRNFSSLHDQHQQYSDGKIIPSDRWSYCQHLYPPRPGAGCWLHWGVDTRRLEFGARWLASPCRHQLWRYCQLGWPAEKPNVVNMYLLCSQYIYRSLERVQSYGITQENLPWQLEAKQA